MARWRRESAFDAEITAAAAAATVPPELLKGIVAQESAFDPKAHREEPTIGDRSRGLGQLLERTARALGFDPAAHARGFDALYDPAINLDLAARLLRRNYEQARGNWDVAVSAYNAGFSSARPWDAKRTPAGDMVNAEYVARVQGNRRYFELRFLPVLVLAVAGAYVAKRFGLI